MFVHLIFISGIWLWQSKYYEIRESQIIECVEQCGVRDNIFKEKEILLEHGFCVCKDDFDDEVKCEDEDRNGIRFAR